MKFAHPYQPHPSIARVWDASCDELARDYRWVSVLEVSPNAFVLIGFYDDINKVLRDGIRYARQHQTLIVSDQKLGDTLVFDDSKVEVE